MTRTAMPRSASPDEDKTAATGVSEAEAARPGRFDTRPDAGPDKAERDGDEEPSDAGETADTKRSSNTATKAAPGAIPPDELTTENDDGAG